MIEKLLLANVLIALLREASAEAAPAVLLIQLHAEAQENDPLTEYGYQLVASRKSDEDMKTFIRRFLKKEGRSIRRRGESELSGFVPFFSGTTAVQSLAAMATELRHASWVDHGLGRTASLSDAGFRSIVALPVDSRAIELKAFIKRFLDESVFKIVDDALFTALVPKLAQDIRMGNAAILGFDNFKHSVIGALVRREIVEPPTGLEAKLNQEGYTLMFGRGDEMKVFIQRLLATEGRKVANMTALHEFVSLPSSPPPLLEDLKLKIRRADWVDHGLGRRVPASDEGFYEIRQLNDDKQMKVFAERILATHGYKVASQAEMDKQLVGIGPDTSYESFELRLSNMKLI